MYTMFSVLELMEEKDRFAALLAVCTTLSLLSLIWSVCFCKLYERRCVNREELADKGDALRECDNGGNTTDHCYLAYGCRNVEECKKVVEFMQEGIFLKKGV
jgi:hypothetical protein